MGFICLLPIQSVQQIFSFQIDCFLWKKCTQGQFNSIYPMFVKTPGQSKGECKHLRRGGGVYMHVHGRVSRDTFGRRLDWKQSLPGVRHSLHLTQLSLPSDKEGHSNWHYSIHINMASTWYRTPLCPTSSWLLPFTIMFVSGLISRDAAVDWNHRRGLSVSWSLLDLGSSEADSDITDSILTASGKDPQKLCPFSRDHSHPICLSGWWCWRRGSSVQHKVKQVLNVINLLIIWRPLYLVLVYISSYSKCLVQPWQPFVKHPNLLREDNQSKCHGQRSVRFVQKGRVADLRGLIEPQDRLFCVNFCDPECSSH